MHGFDTLCAAMRYGVPYKGSKNKIASKLIAAIPSAETFVDLFAGGCAMTHAAILSGRFRRFIANDLDGQGLRLFCDAVNGRYADEKRWISRERFQAENLFIHAKSALRDLYVV